MKIECSSLCFYYVWFIVFFSSLIHSLVQINIVCGLFFASILKQHRNSENSNWCNLSPDSLLQPKLHLDFIPYNLLSSHNGYCSANYQLFIKLLSMQRGYRSSGGLKTHKQWQFGNFALFKDSCQWTLKIELILDSFQNLETNERTHLLQHPINSSPTVIANNGDLSRDNQNSVPQKSESNALNRIVQDFAT